ncbi:hypothetical protein [Flagellimonas aurea]|uniref:hypothetical protein n=1 Tax=Flagellimonas aurea TaxID=2915619 RepID=UPI0035D10227
MDTSFSERQSQGMFHLLIDIRYNGDGDDQFWMKGLLQYIADRHYRSGSNYKRR